MKIFKSTHWISDHACLVHVPYDIGVIPSCNILHEPHHNYVDNIFNASVDFNV